MTELKIALVDIFQENPTDVLATNAEAVAAVRDDVAVTPTGLASYAVANLSAIYAPIAQAVPTGGTTGQKLTKVSDADNDTAWVTDSSAGTVTSITVASDNGFAGTSDGDPAAPEITLSTTITGILSGFLGELVATPTTGAGNVVLSTSPTLVTPVLGTPASVTLTNGTGLPIATGVSGLGSGIATFLATPSSANLASAVTDETGSGALVFASSPTLVTPALGTPSAIDLTNATNLPASSLTGLGTGVATWLATPSSANLAAAVTGETGSGALVFGTSPTLVTPALGTPSAIVLTNGTGLPLTTGVTGILPLANGGTGANLSDPNADRLMFWDDSAGATAYLTLGTNLSITGTTINAAGGSSSPSVDTTASTATLTPDSDAFDIVAVTAQAAGLTIAAPTGTPIDGQPLTIRIRDNGTTRALTWNAAYVPFASGQLPTTTVINKTHYFTFWWNAATSVWELVGGNPVSALWGA